MKILKIAPSILAGFTALLFVLPACNKYEEGPPVSLIPRSERIVNTWIFAYAEEDGEDASDQFDQFELYMNSDGDAELQATYIVFGTAYQSTTTGTWAFTNNQENLLLDFDDNSQDNEYEILRLANKELWLRDLDQDLEIHLLEK